MFKRSQYEKILSRLKERRKYIQVLAGPRQSGKTTLARQIAEAARMKFHYVTADSPTPHGPSWVEQQWETARALASNSSQNESLLILDEIQKVAGWAEVVKKMWDEDTAVKRKMKVLVLGSSPLLIQKGLTESLAGRFELVPITHWSYREMQAAFGWDLNQYIYFGGYPGSAELIDDEERWSRYIQDSLVETTISRDILLMTRIDKQALLRQLFKMGIAYSCQIVSYQKLLGQLHDAGNTTTLAHYLELLSGAGLLTGLHKYSGSEIRRRSSSPKFLAMNNALLAAQSDLNFKEATENKDFWGRLVESAVGSHLFNGTIGSKINLMYWREGSKEVDFVLTKGLKIIAIEVKSGRLRESLSGLDSFSKLYQPSKKLLVGTGGIPVEDFLNMPPQELFS